MPDTTAQMGQQMAERIRSNIENILLTLDDGSLINFTVSIGLYCSRSLTLEQALAHADANLYKAKELGRNRVCISEEQASGEPS